MSLLKQNLARHVDCSARSKMLQNTARYRSGLSLAPIFRGPPFFGYRLGFAPLQHRFRMSSWTTALRDRRRTAPEHYGAFCSTASKEYDELSPAYGLA